MDQHGSRLTVAWLGHSTVAIDIDGTVLLTDPLLQPHAGPLRRRFPQPVEEMWRHADVVLLSHLHHDHAELASLRLLPGVPVLTAPANAAWLRRRGIAGGTGLNDTWDRRTTVEVLLTRAVHGNRPMPHRPNAANGHLIRGPVHSVWAVGDTSLYDEIADLPAMLGRRLDLILVPIAGWGPRLSGGHMGPKEAALACAWSGARWALPVHWGTLHPPLFHLRPAWMDRPHAEFVEVLGEIAPGCRLVDLRPGETWHLDGAD